MKTITFYSYKGGVGRTLALANVAMRLSEFKKKVCIIDFDLEAPGLHHKFKQQLKTFEFKNGIVDYIHEFVEYDRVPESIKDYVKVIDFNAKNKIPIDFIPAGNSLHNDYWKKLARISWKELFYEEDSEGLPFFLDLKGKIEAELQPDFLLIDARTGLSEIAGITVSILADHVVVIAANNEENLQGAKMMMEAFAHPDNIFFDKKPEITFVLSRIPYPTKPEERQRERFLLEEVNKKINFETNKDILVIHSDRELEVKESLMIAKDTDDSVPIAQDYLKLFEAITKDDLSKEEKDSYNDIKKSENFIKEALKTKDSKKRLELFTKAIQLNPNEELYFQYRAEEYFKNKNYESALKDCRETLNINNYNNRAYELTIQSYIDMAKFEEALNTIEKAQQSILHSDLFFYKGIVYDDLKMFNEAIEAYTAAININPIDSISYNNRANTYRKINMIPEAYSDIYNALSLSPKEGISYATLAEIKAKQGDEDEFYKNIELALLFKTPLGEFLSDEVYQPYLKENRFLNLLAKYDIEIPSEINDTENFPSS